MTYEEMMKEHCFQPEETLKGKSSCILCLSSSKDGSSSSQWMQNGMTKEVAGA